jgi:hypothetical protein
VATKAGKKARKVGKVETAVARNIVAAEATDWGQPRRKLHCPVCECEWAGRPRRIFSGHKHRLHAIGKVATWEATTLASVSRSSEGPTTGTPYQRGKRQHNAQEWDEGRHDSQTKAAHIGTDPNDAIGDSFGISYYDKIPKSRLWRAARHKPRKTRTPSCAAPARGYVCSFQGGSAVFAASFACLCS